MIQELQKQTKQLHDPAKAKLLAGFFKTGKGQYGEGDTFYGITVPASRKIAKQYVSMSFEEVAQLLESKIHEERLIALLILVQQYTKADPDQKKAICTFYLRHTKHINNWDLVDLSAPRIVGMYLHDYNAEKAKDILTKLAHSPNLWEKRIAMLSTLAFIVKGEAEPALTIADILLHEKHDLMHKAVGWMLREVGKRVSQDIEEDFLKTRYKTMPRTTLRYAIERFDEHHRKEYLTGVV